MAEKLTLVIDLDTGAVEKGLSDVEKRVTRKGKAIGDGFAKGLKVAGAAVGAIGAYSIKSAADAETAFAKLQTIAGKDIDKLREQIMALPPELGGVAESAEAAYQAISAGRKPGEAVDFIAKAARAAKGGFTDTTTAVDAATTIMNSYGDSAGSAGQIFDKFLRTQNLGKTTFAELAPRIGEVAKTADVAGESFDSLLGSIATLTASGIRTPQAITGIRAALSNISKPSKEAADELARIGVTLTKEDGLIGSLEKIRNSSDDLGGSITKIFGSVEARAAIETLNGDFEKTKSNIDAISAASGDSNEAFGVMNDTLHAQLAALQVDVQKVAAEFGKTLMPELKAGVGFLKENFSTIEGIIGTSVEFIKKAADGVKFLSQGAGDLYGRLEDAAPKAMDWASREYNQTRKALDPSLAAARGAAGNAGSGAANGFINALPGGAAAQGLWGFMGRADGGYISGPGGPRSDVIPAMLSNGEYVINARATSSLGLGFLNALNSGGARGFAGGGSPLGGSSAPLPGGFGVGGSMAGLGAVGERLQALKDRVRKVIQGGTTEGVVRGAEVAVGSAKGKDQKTLAAQVYTGASASLQRSIIDGAKSGSVSGAVKGFAKGLGAQVFQQVQQALVSSLGKKLLGGLFGGGLGGFFADGGRPPMGVPSIVGERGPEFFVPDQPGTIIPNEVMSSMGGGSVHLNFAPGSIQMSGDDRGGMGEEFVRQVFEVGGRLAEMGAITGAAQRLAEAGA